MQLNLVRWKREKQEETDIVATVNNCLTTLSLYKMIEPPRSADQKSIG